MWRTPHKYVKYVIKLEVQSDDFIFFNFLSAQSTDLGEELFGGEKIIEKYWKLMEKLNIEIPISTAVLISKNALRLNKTRALQKRILYCAYF